ncbi:hypothetical protein MMAD_47540 [Mycolicibacterium madagascariense]|uniref:Intersectin-EH binding protein Ibp1 n=1 Tax=Mycolicibacterium madagascariense TaxID=212765 RepID=A0A7I7XMJ4_9MYCO|nr:intersectin-EH binding protein Ibp1 [Mycolicibacterium madagascariense]MCV7013152.1 intersectin-EH binding protein Ibp1 [Mycolicibacterium madagascariense]BBZ30459.1 hypothetical protein MMAD_47540 [Mycolicibacterium madagascariense]
MAHCDISLRRMILAGGFALVLAGGPAVVALSTPAIAGAVTSCQPGEEEDLYSGACLPHTAPSSPAGGGSAVDPIPGGSLSAVDGVPCTGGDTGKCIGLQEDAPQFQQPPTSIDGQ